MAAAAVRAQAVAARTYAAFDRAAHPTRYYHTCDTTSCQVYGGVGDEDSRSNAAVDATAGKVVTYGGKPAFTQFGSSSGGWISAGSQPYLVAKADPYDGFSGNPMHTWTTTLTKASIQKAYPSLGTLKRVLVTQRDGNGDWYGRVEQMTLDGTKADVTLTGDAFRSKFGLRSSWFHFGSGPTPTPTPAAQPLDRRRPRRPTRRSTSAGRRSAAHPRSWAAPRARSSPSPAAAPAVFAARPDLLQDQRRYPRAVRPGAQGLRYARWRGLQARLPADQSAEDRHQRRVARFEHGTIARTQVRQGAGHLPLTSLSRPVGGRR